MARMVMIIMRAFCSLASLLLLLFLVVFILSAVKVDSYSLVNTPVSQLLKTHASSIQTLKEEASKIVPSMDVEPYCNDVFFLRYCLDDEETSSDVDRVNKLKDNLNWRCNGSGKVICDAARTAIAQAQPGEEASSSWNNEPVRNSAMHAKKINEFITPEQCLTTSSAKGNYLIYCIRAGKINDAALMETVSVSEMVDFFLYCKEVHNVICNQRSIAQDTLMSVVAVNDLSGLTLFGDKSGDANFRSALSESSKQANQYYPNLAGPTLLLNLPRLVGALVKLFTPLFPPTVRKRLKFEQGPLKNVNSLQEISYGGPHRESFLQELETILNKE